VARSARIGRVAAGGAMRWAGDRIDRRGGEDARRRRRGDRVVATIDALVDQLAHMRGAAMKAGQVLSTIELPGLEEDQAAYLRERLGSLRDSVPPVGWRQMRRVLEEDWGERPERVLAEIDTQPAAAASIGQVYRGVTRDGRAVAIKVQYPGIAETVEADMRNVRLLAPLLRQLLPGLQIRPLLDELRERVVEECDYEMEAQYHRRVQRWWRGHPFVRVPEVDTEHSRRRVLVSEWIDGESFPAVCEREAPVRDRYGEIIFRFFYATALEVGLAAGDPHPGNYLLCPDGSVAFFDFGMMRHLPPEMLAREAAIARAVRAADARAVLDGLDELGYLPAGEQAWNAELILEHMQRVSWWLQGDEPRRLAPEDMWHGAEHMREDPAVLRELRRMTLPPEALLLRRMEGLLFQALGIVRGCAPWGVLYRELVMGDPPGTELGRAHAAWRGNGAPTHPDARRGGWF
jgi:predicted unusual protein kinase regulating ubiquinone biosynthesis (AarF/ABC1/UbiB family)